MLTFVFYKTRHRTFQEKSSVIITLLSIFFLLFSRTHFLLVFCHRVTFCLYFHTDPLFACLFPRTHFLLVFSLGPTFCLSFPTQPLFACLFTRTHFLLVPTDPLFVCVLKVGLHPFRYLLQPELNFTTRLLCVIFVGIIEFLLIHVIQPFFRN